MTDELTCRCPDCATRIAIDLTSQSVDEWESIPWKLRGNVVHCGQCENEFELLFYERTLSRGDASR